MRAHLTNLTFVVLSVLVWIPVDAARLSVKGGTVTANPQTGESVLLLAVGDEYALELTTGRPLVEQVIAGVAEAGFILQRRSASEGTMMVNGRRMSHDYTTSYLLRPTNVGTFTLGPAAVKTDTEEEASNAVTVSVVSQQEYDRLTNGRGGRQTANMQCLLQVEPKEVVVGEPVRVTVTLRDDGQALERGVGAPAFQGMTSTKDEKAHQAQRFINGQMVHELVQGFTVTPQEAGTFTIGPAIGQFVVPDRKDPFSMMGMPSLFGSVFGGGGKKRNVESGIVSLTVAPLPPTHKQVDGIGTFTDFQMRISKKNAALNEPIEVSLTVQGKGNFDAIIAPELQLPEHMVTYESGSDFVPFSQDQREGSKTFTYVLQIGQPGAQMLPAQEFTYFDTVARAYKTLRTQPQEIAIKGTVAVPTDDPVAEPSAVPLPDATQAAAPAAPRVGGGWQLPPQQVPWWWLLVVICASLLWIVRAHLLRAAWLIAEKTGLTSPYKRARAKVRSLVARRASAELRHFFENLLTELWREEVGALERGLIAQKGTAWGWDSKHIEQFAAYLDLCGQAAFASDLLSDKERGEVLKKAEYWFELCWQGYRMEKQV